MCSRRSGRFPATGLALAFLMGLATPHSSAAPDKAAFLSELRAMEKDVAAMEEIWFKTIPEAASRGPKPAKPKILLLTLKNAVDKRYSPQIRLVDIAGRWTEGECWMPEWNRAVHTITRNTLNFSRDGATGKSLLEGNIHLTLTPDGIVPMENKPLEASFRVKVSGTGDRMEGTYQTFVPATEDGKTSKPGKLDIQPASGQAAGTFVELGPDGNAAPTNRPSLPDGPLDIYRIYGLCAKQESRASILYADLRAMAVARVAKMDFWEAKNETVVVDPVREAFDPPSAVKEASRSKANATTDEIMGEASLLDDAPKTGSKSSSPDPRAGDALARISNMRQRVAIMLAYVREYDRTGGDKTEWLTDTLKTDDPEFGPWYGQDSLKVTGGTNQLPAGCGGDGPQLWPRVSEWRVMEPFPLTRMDIVTPGLPDVVLDPTIKVNVETARLKQEKSCTVTVAEWREPMRVRQVLCPPQITAGNRVYRACPPPLGGYLPHSGIEYSTSYFASVVESPEEQTVWTGIGVNDRGRLWVNGKVVWQGPTAFEDRFSEYAALIRIPFRKGANHLLLRLDVDYSSPYMWMRLCTQGQPRDQIAVKAKEDAVSAVRKTVERDRIVGWRGDGSGLYPDADPPVAWNQKTGRNVRWFTPLPYWSNSTPVPVPGTNLLFVTMEPHWLLCLNKDSGAILWKRPVTLIDLLPEPLKKEGWDLYEKWWQAREVLNAVPFSETSDWEKKWQEYSAYWAEGTGIWAPGKEKKNPREGASPELLKLLDRKEALEAAEDPQAVADELTKVSKEIASLKAAAAKSDPNSAENKLARLSDALKTFLGFLGRFSYVSGTSGYWIDYSGYTFSTPVTDGKYVWVKTGMDVVACFDLDGHVVWMKRIWGCTNTDHSISSPRLVDGRLIMELVSVDPFPLPGDKEYDDKKKPDKKARDGAKFLALDAATGKQCWETRGAIAGDWNCSTPTITTLTDGKERMKVIVTAGGQVIRVDDGKIIVPDMGISTGFASVQSVQDVVLFTRPFLAPIRLIMRDRDTVGSRRLWTLSHGFHGLDFGGITADNERIYCSTGPGDTVKQGPNEVWKGVTVYDMGTGNRLAQLPTMRKGGNHYTLGALSARHFYGTDGDKIFQDVSRHPPQICAVLTREASPLLLAINAVDRAYGGPAMEGDRLYYHSYMGVLCVGYTGDEGRKYEAVTVARQLLDDVYPDVPTESTVLTPKNPRGNEMVNQRYGQPKFVSRKCGYANAASGQAPDVWWSLGPFPLEKADTVLEAIGGPAAVLNGDNKFEGAGIKSEWVPFAAGQFKAATRDWEQDWKNLTDVNRNRRVVEFGRLLGDRTNTVTYLVTALKWDEPCVMRFEQAMPGIRAWIGGTPLKSGDRVRFDAGICQLLMEIRVTDIPKDGLSLSPRFWASNDVKKEQESRRAEIDRRRPYYEAVIKMAPDSQEARLAKHVLATL